MVDVPATVAALGARISVPTLDGAQEVGLDAGTQPGETITLRGQGMPVLRRPGRRGDLRAIVNVVIPRKLSREQREIVEQLAATLHEDNLRQDEGLVSKLKRALPGVIRLGVRVAKADADLVLAELLELVPQGVEERELGPDTIEYGVYGAEGELPELHALRAAAGTALVEVVTEQVADDWADRWRAFHVPVEIAGRMLVRPPWSPPPEDPAIIDLVIDPAQAFGTGAHPTTKLCLELLLDLEPAGPFMDLGCGSGVLAIAAARLGWTPVEGVDFDPLSVAATIENAEVNGTEVSARRFDLLRDGPAPTAPTVAANLLRPLLLAVARAGFDGPAPEHIVASGLLRAEADEVSAALAARTGLQERARLEEGDWAALLLARSAA